MLMRGLVFVVAAAVSGPCADKFNEAADRAIDGASTECSVLVERGEDSLKKYCAQLWLTTFEWGDIWQRQINARFDRTDAEIGDVGDRMDSIDERLAAIEAALSGVCQ